MIKAIEKDIGEVLSYSGSDYSIQLKVNGTRTTWNRFKLVSNDGIDRTNRFKHISDSLNKIDIVLDGEMALGFNGNVFDVSRKENWNKATYWLFDVYSLDGIDVRDKPLKERLVLLKQIAERLGNQNIKVIPQFEEVDIAWDFILQNKCEGLVIKNLLLTNPSELYEEIRLDIKVKNWHEGKEQIKDWDSSGGHGAFTTVNDNRLSALTVKNGHLFLSLKDIKPLFAEFDYMEITSSGKFFQPQLKRIIDNEGKIYFERGIK